VLFTGPEPLYLEGDSWRIVVELNVSAWSADLWRFREEVDTFSAGLREVAQRFKEFAVCERELVQLHILKDEVLKANDALVDLLPHGRVKRGLFNFGGRLVKVLFGNPDADDYAELQRRVQSIETSDGAVKHMLDAQITLTRRIGAQTERLTREVEKWAQAAVGEMSRIRQYIQTLSYEIKSIDNRVKLALNVSSLLRTLETSALKALIDIRELSRGLESLAGNRLGASLLSPTEFSHILKNVSRSLPVGLRLFAGDDPVDAYAYYNLVDVHGLSLAGVITILIDVPLVSAESTFELYRVYTLPVRNPQSGLYSLVETEMEYFLVSGDAEFYAALPGRQLETCRHQQPWICPVTFPVQSRHTPSCLSGLAYSGTAEHCRKLVLTKPSFRIWIWDPTRKGWVYSVTEEDQLVSRCQSGGKTVVSETKIQGIGRVEAARGCALLTQGYRMLPSTRREMKTTISQRIQVTLPTARLDATTKVSKDEVAGAMDDLVKQGRVFQPHQGLYGIQEDTLRSILEERIAHQERTKGLLVGGGLAVSTLAVAALATLAWWKRGFLGTLVRRRGPATTGDGHPPSTGPGYVFFRPETSDVAAANPEAKPRSYDGAINSVHGAEK